MSKTTVRMALAVALLLAAVRLQAAAKGPFTVALRFTPQESVGASVPDLAPGVTDRPVRLALEDGRAGEDPAVIGQATDDDDQMGPVRAEGDVVAYAADVLQKAAAEWGIKTAADAPLALKGKLTRFHLNESNKAVGSTYNADVRVAFALQDAKGRTLWEGNGAGDATRYGRKRSQDNANEVLSDAIKEAYASLFANAGLQDAWLGKAAPAAAAQPAAVPTLTPAELLAELVKLKKQGFTTDLLVGFVEQKTLSAPLSADDLVQWKKEGMPQEVIKAALGRAPKG